MLLYFKKGKVMRSTEKQELNSGCVRSFIICQSSASVEHCCACDIVVYFVFLIYACVQQTRSKEKRKNVEKERSFFGLTEEKYGRL